MRFNLGLIVAKTDNGIPCLGTSNLGPQINNSTKKNRKTNTKSSFLIFKSYVQHFHAFSNFYIAKILILN